MAGEKVATGTELALVIDARTPWVAAFPPEPQFLRGDLSSAPRLSHREQIARDNPRERAMSHR